MAQIDSESGDESDLPTPNFLRKSHRSHSRGSPVTPSSITSSVIFGQIPEEVLRVWSQLPEAVRLDPSLALFQREYDRVNRVTETKSQDYVVVNMSLGIQPAVSVRVPNIRDLNEANNEQDAQASQDTQQMVYCRYAKLTVLFCCWLIFTVREITRRRNHRLTNVELCVTDNTDVQEREDRYDASDLDLERENHELRNLQRAHHGQMGQVDGARFIVALDEKRAELVHAALDRLARIFDSRRRLQRAPLRIEKIEECKRRMDFEYTARTLDGRLSRSKAREDVRDKRDRR